MPDGSEMLYTGGWDNAVRFWDIRTGEKTSGLLGPQINGETVDVSKDMKTVLTGGGTLGEGIQLWDIRNLDRPTSTINWHENMTNKVNPMIYCCRLIPGHPYVLAGARDSKAAKCFDINTGKIVKEFPIADDSYCMDISKNGALVGFGDSAGLLHLEDINFERIMD